MRALCSRVRPRERYMLLLAPMVTHGDDAVAVACWGTLALGMLLGIATATGLGIVVVPERAPEELSAIHALAAGSLVLVCENPPPPYRFPGPTGFEDMQERTQPLRHSTQSPDAPVFHPVTPNERSTSGRVSGLRVVGRTIVLHTLFYVTRSLATNAWSTRAIKYAIGIGCLASFMLLVKAFDLADTLLEYLMRARGRSGPLDAGAERKFLTALIVGLSTGIPGIGYCILSLASVGPADDHEFLTQAFSGVVPAFFVVMVTIRWMG
ncbi:hypothetical protein V8D89_007073 [Ganoderma adspersum]